MAFGASTINRCPKNQCLLQHHQNHYSNCQEYAGTRIGSESGIIDLPDGFGHHSFLAVLFAIARGFGFENIIQSEILDYLGMTPIGNVPQGESNLMIEIITLINNSLEYAKGSGVFAGVGVVLLLYTVFTLFRDIENNFNRIWQIKKDEACIVGLSIILH